MHQRAGRRCPAINTRPLALPSVGGGDGGGSLPNSRAAPAVLVFSLRSVEPHPSTRSGCRKRYGEGGAELRRPRGAIHAPRHGELAARGVHKRVAMRSLRAASSDRRCRQVPLAPRRLQPPRPTAALLGGAICRGRASMDRRSAGDSLPTVAAAARRLQPAPTTSPFWHLISYLACSMASLAWAPSRGARSCGWRCWR